MAASADTAHVERIWEHPQLCVPIFGFQPHSDEAAEAYEQPGISDELLASD